MPTTKRPAVSPRLTATLKSRRQIATRLLAFTRCAESLRGFDRETALCALTANTALIGRHP